jgi:hypothetical protein
MDSGVHMYVVAKLRDPRRAPEGRRSTVRGSGRTSGVSVEGTVSITGLDRRAGREAGE